MTDSPPNTHLIGRKLEYVYEGNTHGYINGNVGDLWLIVDAGEYKYDDGKKFNGLTIVHEQTDLELKRVDIEDALFGYEGSDEPLFVLFPKDGE